MNSALLSIAERMRIKIERVPFLTNPINGAYCTARDIITINLMPVEFMPDVCLAHELVHATGHYKRLNRGMVANWTKYLADTKSIFIPNHLRDIGAMMCEEVIAQYGAMTLLNQLNIYIPSLEADTARYLNHFGAIDGKPSKELARQAEIAVEYLLLHLENKAAA